MENTRQYIKVKLIEFVNQTLVKSTAPDSDPFQYDTTHEVLHNEDYTGDKIVNYSRLMFILNAYLQPKLRDINIIDFNIKDHIKLRDIREALNRSTMYNINKQLDILVNRVPNTYLPIVPENNISNVQKLSEERIGPKVIVRNIEYNKKECLLILLLILVVCVISIICSRINTTTMSMENIDQNNISNQYDVNTKTPILRTIRSVENYSDNDLVSALKCIGVSR